MKKGWLSFVLSIFLSLVAISAWLLANPQTALAGSCCASCPGTISQCCFGDNCSATDGIGCSASQGGSTIERLCGKSPGDLE